MNRRLIAAVILTGLLVGPAWAQGEPPPRPEKPNGVSSSWPATDPTKNVEALVKALEEKTKELREADVKLTQSKLDAVKDIAELRAQHNRDMINRQEKEIILRSDLGSELTKKETDRINAIRLVDVQAVQVATERQTQAATALASQVVQSAEVLRNQQARAQEEARISLAASNAELTKRISELERSLSEGRGKQQFQDPEAIAMKAQLQVLLQQQSAAKGTDTGQSNVIFYIFGGLLVVAAVGGLALNMNKKPDPALAAMLAELQKRSAA